MLTNIIIWVVVGAIAGWLASVVLKSNKSQNLLGDIIVGIIGAVIGGFVLNALGIGGGVSGLNLPSIATAFVGAIILLLILRAIR